jgi:hypothetical protein
MARAQRASRGGVESAAEDRRRVRRVCEAGMLRRSLEAGGPQVPAQVHAPVGALRGARWGSRRAARRLVLPATAGASVACATMTRKTGRLSPAGARRRRHRSRWPQSSSHRHRSRRRMGKPMRRPPARAARHCRRFHRAATTTMTRKTGQLSPAGARRRRHRSRWPQSSLHRHRRRQKPPPPPRVEPR